MRPFESVMAKNLEDYAAYRRQRGYAQRAINPPLVAFDRYLKAHHVSWEQLQQPAFFLHLRATISHQPEEGAKAVSSVYLQKLLGAQQPLPPPLWWRGDGRMPTMG